MGGLEAKRGPRSALLAWLWGLWPGVGIPGSVSKHPPVAVLSHCDPVAELSLLPGMPCPCCPLLVPPILVEASPW